jgi:hypothetical protein
VHLGERFPAPPGAPTIPPQFCADWEARKSNADRSSDATVFEFGFSPNGLACGAFRSSLRLSCSSSDPPLGFGRSLHRTKSPFVLAPNKQAHNVSARQPVSVGQFVKHGPLGDGHADHEHLIFCVPCHVIPLYIC